MRSTLLWTVALALLGLGLAAVFASVLVSGLFLPGVVLIDAGLLGTAAAGALSARRATP